MGWFKRWREKKKQSQEPITIRQWEADGADLEAPMPDQREIGHHVLDHCEQIIEAAREVSDEKKEYGIVTSYLKDIETLTDLPDGQKEPIRKVAERIGQLDHTRNEYLNTSKKLSDVQFIMMERMEAEIPDAIRRLQTNEAYQTTVKSDMAYLEGEKLQWTLHRNELLYEKHILKIASCIVFSLFILFMVLLVVLEIGFSVDITWGWIIIAALAVGSGAFIFIRYQNATAGIVRAEINANHAIELLNRTKIKYVNITNAVDYACEKYHVKNARDFEYQWEQYLEAVKERERYMRTNDELDYCKKKLIGLLNNYALYDTHVWTEQSYALLHPAEMSEIKHNLLVRRQKLRARIQYNSDIVEAERAQIDRLMQLHPEYEEKIRDIIQSVDKLTTGAI